MICRVGILYKNNLICFFEQFSKHCIRDGLSNIFCKSTRDTHGVAYYGDV